MALCAVHHAQYRCYSTMQKTAHDSRNLPISTNRYVVKLSVLDECVGSVRGLDWDRKPIPHSAQTKRGQNNKGTVTLIHRIKVTVPFIVWGRGWDGRYAPGHAASPPRPSNRVRFRNLLGKNAKGPIKGPFTFWRRGWDSNPRYGVTVHLISNQARSTTPAPLPWSVPSSHRGLKSPAPGGGAPILVSNNGNGKGPWGLSRCDQWVSRGMGSRCCD